MKTSELLVSEKMPWMVMAFGYLSIVPLIGLGMFGWRVIDAVSGIASGTERIQSSCIAVNPPICTSFEVYPLLLPNLIWLGVTLALIIALWMLAFRYRAVWHDADGTIRITWGERTLPIVLRRFRIDQCTNVTVTKEQRFSISPIVGTSVIRTKRAPDRWRVRGEVAKQRVNLGSYESEARAREIVKLFSHNTEEGVDNDESGVWHYGRL